MKEAHKYLSFFATVLFICVCGWELYDRLVVLWPDEQYYSPERCSTPSDPCFFTVQPGEPQCGDGFCDAEESPHNCPEDCGDLGPMQHQLEELRQLDRISEMSVVRIGMLAEQTEELERRISALENRGADRPSDDGVSAQQSGAQQAIGGPYVHQVAYGRTGM